MMPRLDTEMFNQILQAIPDPATISALNAVKAAITRLEVLVQDHGERLEELDSADEPDPDADEMGEE
jgi:hypothetical protein